MSRRARRSAGEYDSFDSEATPARRAFDVPEAAAPVRMRPFVLGITVLATALCGGFALTSSVPAAGTTIAQPAATTATYDSSNVDTLSRGAIDREAAIAVASATPTAAATTAAPAPVVFAISSVAYLRDQPATTGKILATLAVGTKVTAAADAANGWQSVTTGTLTGFVKTALLTTPKAATSTKTVTVSSAYPACASGSAVESGLVAHTILVHRAVCTTYPSITSYGGTRGDGSEHASGHALDIMVSGSLGTDVAAWLKANYASLGITEIIYQQHIWTTQRASEGWRAMEDRGSATANHYDHIHVLTS